MPRRTATRAAVFMPGARPPACRIATRLISPVGSGVSCGGVERIWLMPTIEEKDEPREAWAAA